MMVLEARGIRFGFASRLPRLLPAGVFGWVVQKVAFAPNTMFRKLFDVIAVSVHGETHAGGPLAAFPRDVLLEARRLHVEVPRLEALNAMLGL